MTAVAARPAAQGVVEGAREVRSVAMHDPLVRPLLDELSHEYWTRYQRVLSAEELRAEMEHYPAQDFAAPPATGSPAVRTAELKRIWTHSAHRRRGLARVVLAELERRAVERGYRRVYLTTGPRQPEAAGLYLATGYTPLFDTGTDPEEIGPLAFEKWLEVAP